MNIKKSKRKENSMGSQVKSREPVQLPKSSLVKKSAAGNFF